MRTLAIRITLHTVAFAAPIALLPCLAAYTVRFGEAWACAGTHFVTMMLANAYFLRRDPALIRRRLAMTRAETDVGQRRIKALLALLSIATLALAGLDRRFGWSHAPPILVAMAYVAIAAGAFVVFLAMRENSYLSANIEIDSGQTVVDTGPYRAARHPMYAGFALIGAATPLALASCWAEVLYAPAFAVMVARLLREERFLAAQLPGYSEYMRRTRYRLVPRVW
jgi:protein-S-isoprenylcysteine O-methyltransferase Ste14